MVKFIAKWSLYSAAATRRSVPRTRLVGNGGIHSKVVVILGSCNSQKRSAEVPCRHVMWKSEQSGRYTRQLQLVEAISRARLVDSVGSWDCWLLGMMIALFTVIAVINYQFSSFLAILCSWSWNRWNRSKLVVILDICVPHWCSRGRNWLKMVVYLFQVSMFCILTIFVLFFRTLISDSIVVGACLLNDV